MFLLTCYVIHSTRCAPSQTWDEINIWALRLKKWTSIQWTLSMALYITKHPLPLKPFLQVYVYEPKRVFTKGHYFHENFVTRADKTSRALSLGICRNDSVVNRNADCSIRHWASSCRRAAPPWSNQEESWLVNMARHIWAPLSLGEAAPRQSVTQPSSQLI